MEVSREKECSMPDDIKSIVEDTKLYDEVHNAVQVLKPVAEALNKVKN